MGYLILFKTPSIKNGEKMGVTSVLNVCLLQGAGILKKIPTLVSPQKIVGTEHINLRS